MQKGRRKKQTTGDSGAGCQSDQKHAGQRRPPIQIEAIKMIRASIYRTCPEQIKEKGECALDGMRFANTSKEEVSRKCDELVEYQGIRNPRIVIEEIED